MIFLSMIHHLRVQVQADEDLGLEIGKDQGVVQEGENDKDNVQDHQIEKDNVIDQGQLPRKEKEIGKEKDPDQEAKMMSVRIARVR